MGSTETLDGVWRLALEDARIAATDALVIRFPGTRSAFDGVCGRTWQIRMPLTESRDLDENADWISVLNGPSRDLYRVAAWTDHPIEILAALLRHELEHGHLFAQHGIRLQGLHCEAVDRLRACEGDGTDYQFIPMEADANAAGGRFVRRVFGDDRIDAVLAAGAADEGFRCLLATSPGPWR